MPNRAQICIKPGAKPPAYEPNLSCRDMTSSPWRSPQVGVFLVFLVAGEQWNLCAARSTPLGPLTHSKIRAVPNHLCVQIELGYLLSLSPAPIPTHSDWGCSAPSLPPPPSIQIGVRLLPIPWHCHPACGSKSLGTTSIKDFIEDIKYFLEVIKCFNCMAKSYLKYLHKQSTYLLTSVSQ